MAQFEYQSLLPFTGSSVFTNTTLKSNGDDDKTESPKIRLLTILPGTGGDKISARLQVFSLQQVANNAAYEALSYCWGEEDASVGILLGNICEAKEQASTFHVRPSLHSALCAFRYHDRPRTLWVDAICINQADGSEKRTQIPLMRQIFDGATRTLVWLGGSTPDSEAAIRLVCALAAAWEKCNGNIPAISKLKSDDMPRHGLPTYPSKDYDSFLSLLALPWFERAWVVQEIIVSKSAWVYWGSERVDWKDLVTAVFFTVRVEMPFITHPAVNRLIVIADEDYFYRNGKCRLLSVLLRHRSCQATLPLDKVYAFMCLTEGNSHIPIDYNQNLATAYTSIAKQIIQHEKSLDILSLPATPFTSKIMNLPSWVPDWTIVPADKSRRGFSVEGISLANTEERGSRISKPFSAAESPSDRLTIHRLPEQDLAHALVVEGHRLDIIPAAICDIPYCGCSDYPSKHRKRYDRYTKGSQEAVNAILEWERYIGLTEKRSSAASWPSPTLKYLTGEDLLDAFLETILVGNISPTEDKSKLREEYLAWSAEQRHARRMTAMCSRASIWGMMESYKLYRDVPESLLQRMQAVMFRTFAKTEGGYMGLVSGDVQAGDEIWLLKGCKVPVVLRACGGGEERRVVGDAYVHGVMYGEAFEEEKCQRIVLV